MDWFEILQNSLKKQQEMLNAVKAEGRDFTNEEKEQYEALTTRINNAKENMKREKELKETQNLIDEQKKINDEEKAKSKPDNSSTSVHVKNDNTKKWKNGLGSIAQAAVNYAKNGVLPDHIHNAASGANETIPEDGGFLVGGEEGQGLMKLIYEKSNLAGRCDERNLTNGDRYSIPYAKDKNRATGSRFVNAYWTAEAESVTKTKPQYGKFELTLEKIMARMDITSELMQDVPLLEQEIESSVSDELAWMLDDKIINGNGAGVPLGILNSSALVTVAKESGQTNYTIVANNIVKMEARLWGQSTNAAWFINQDIIPQLYTMTIGTSEVPIYMPANGLSDRPYATLMGRPVVKVEQCQTLGTKGDIILADLNQYMLIKKGEIRKDVSIHVRFDTDENALRFVMRVNGAPKWETSITPANGTNKISSFIALANRK